MRKACVLKLLSLIDAICKYSLEQERIRGESIETIQTRIEQTKLGKQKQRLRVMGNNKPDKNKSVEEDDDGDSEDKKQLLGIMNNCREQADIVSHLFNFVEDVSNSDAETPTVIM